jgi:hypothetical protein
VTFGLGTSADPVTVQIRWPDGGTTLHPDLAVGRLHTIVRDAASPAP